MFLNKEKLEKLIDDNFQGNYSKAAVAFGVTPQHIHKLMKIKSAKAGAELLGGFATYCFQHQLNYWDYVFLPCNLTKVKLNKLG